MAFKIGSREWEGKTYDIMSGRAVDVAKSVSRHGPEYVYVLCSDFKGGSHEYYTSSNCGALQTVALFTLLKKYGAPYFTDAHQAKLDEYLSILENANYGEEAARPRFNGETHEAEASILKTILEPL